MTSRKPLLLAGKIFKIPLAVRSVAVVALLCSLLLCATWLLTQSRVQEQQRLFTQQQLAAVLGGINYNNKLDTDYLTLNRQQDRGRIFRARLNGAPVATIYDTVTRKGYSGAIRMLIGIDTEQQLIGVRILEHRETPGLGDAIELEKSDWIKGFDGLSLETTLKAGWAVKKDGGEFDQFTGATITPRAVVNRVYETLALHKEINDRIFQLDAGQEFTQ